MQVLVKLVKFITNCVVSVSKFFKNFNMKVYGGG